jgi:hypothetical protein
MRTRSGFMSTAVASPVLGPASRWIGLEKRQAVGVHQSPDGAEVSCA